MKYAKVLGERNCGTRYLEQLLKTNFDLRLKSFNPYKPLLKSIYQIVTINSLAYIFHSPISLGWKHAIPYKTVFSLGFAKQTAVLILVKNPYSFLLSLHKRPYHNEHLKGSDFHNFIQSPWKTVLKENHWSNFSNPIKLWNVKNNAFLKLEESYANVVIIKYEELIKNPKATLKQVANRFNLIFQESTFQNIDKSTKRRSANFEFYQEYYLKQKWLSELTAEDVRHINNQLDRQVLEKLGYGIINPNLKG